MNVPVTEKRIMRDNRYIAVHRGGPLTKERHRLLALWAASCAEHVLHLFTEAVPKDPRPQQAIELARAWARGECSVGEARAASVAAHAAAREVGTGVAQLVARAAGHAVATAHMADHAPGAAMFAIKALRAKGEESEASEEFAWQKAQLPPEINDLVLSTFKDKFDNFGF